MVSSATTTGLPGMDTMTTAGDLPGSGHIEATLGGLAGVSPVLAGAYLTYLLARTLIPAVLIIATIGGVPARHRGALLRTYLRSTRHRPLPQPGTSTTDSAHTGSDDATGVGR